MSYKNRRKEVFLVDVYIGQDPHPEVPLNEYTNEDVARKAAISYKKKYPQAKVTIQRAELILTRYGWDKETGYAPLEVTSSLDFKEI